MGLKSQTAYWLECDRCGQTFFEPKENTNLEPCTDSNDVIEQALADGWSISVPDGEWCCDNCLDYLQRYGGGRV